MINHAIVVVLCDEICYTIRFFTPRIFPYIGGLGVFKRGYVVILVLGFEKKNLGQLWAELF